MRDDFSASVKRTLKQRVGSHCSNPNCRKLTDGPALEVDRGYSTGKAAHIEAASVGGPRYNVEMSPIQRKSIENGIWLCATCADFIDSDPFRYPVQVLKEWKSIAEKTAHSGVTGTSTAKKTETKLEFNLNFTTTLQQSELHKYILMLEVKNIGNQIINEFIVDLTMLTEPILERDKINQIVKGKSNQEFSYFRFYFKEQSDLLLTGDFRAYQLFTYYMDHKLYWDSLLGEKLVQLRVVIPNVFDETKEIKFNDLNNF